jgi:ribose-phosphate pyrophosphokinase
MKIFSGRASEYFAKDVCNSLGIKLGKSEREDFSDGEFTPNINETVRGENVYLIQSTFQPCDNLFELLMMADACRRSGAKNIIAVIPYYGFARQDRKTKPRVPITAALVADFIKKSGVNHVVTMDLHCEQIQGFFSIPVSHVYSHVALIPFLKERFFNEEVICISPDMGSSKRTNEYSQFLKTDMAICYKLREKANEIKEMKLIGEVEGKHAIIIDDLIDTAGTLCRCADMLIEKGAKSVNAVITHPVLSGKAYENLGKSKIKELIVTNSIPLIEDSKVILDKVSGYKKITVVNVAPLFANVINNIENNSSISANFLV